MNEMVELGCGCRFAVGITGEGALAVWCLTPEKYIRCACSPSSDLEAVTGCWLDAGEEAGAYKEYFGHLNPAKPAPVVLEFR